ncbi:MAG: hypothetical protein HY866_00090 [Chloroflexi bacterium]|nr:hypothetical protein [Chloroflexota bacterium]
MQTDGIFSQKTLKLSLYSGIMLIVISMLFLGREVKTSPFLMQLGLAILTPASFYIIGALVYRQLNAPLAAPGIVATGAWLVVIELVHFYDRRAQLPRVAEDYYWLLASLLAAVIVTLTAYRARIWLLVPLVPLAQINATWAVMSATGLSIAWWPVFSFLLVLAWWEMPLHDQEWRQAYRVSAVLLEVFLLIFSYWLPIKTEHSMLITWAACALLVAILALRHGWINLGPLAMVLLACAAAWGLPLVWWPLAWLVIGVGMVIFIEQLARHEVESHTLALELSTALAVLLSGLAALLAKTAMFIGSPLAPLVVIPVLAASGSLMIWIGRRRELNTAQHAGLWLLAAAWGELYFALFDTSEGYGLWLSLLAVVALLTERLLLTWNRGKRKTTYSVREVVARWPLADLVIGLTVLIVLWSGFTSVDLPATDPLIVAVTVAIVVGVWLVAGLVYRMPVLIHVALWLAPLPYTLMLILLAPHLATLQLFGLALQFLAMIYLLIGHLLHRQRPAVLAPFFVAGYIQLGLGLTMTLSQPMLLIVALMVVVIVCFVTSLIVILGGHPAWDVAVARLIPPDRRPYAYRHVHQLFVFLTAWLLAIWLYLMLGAAAFSPARQGIILVLMSSAWIVLGRLLPRLPGVVGWPVYAAGWFMWFTGLLLVFFAPPEAIITAIFGLALSAEALHRSKAIHWMPVFILQILFSVLQVAWMIDLPGHSLLLAVTMGLCLAGMVYDRPERQAGTITALTGGGLSLLIWLVRIDPITTLGISLLALAALLRYRRCELGLVFHSTLALLLLITFGLALHWRIFLLAGGLQLVIGLLLVIWTRPRRFRTLHALLFKEFDWASSFLWIGGVSFMAGIWSGWLSASEMTLPLVVVGIALAGCTLWLHVPRLPYLPLIILTAAFLLHVDSLVGQPFQQAGSAIAAYGVWIAAFVLAIQTLVTMAVRDHWPINRARWLVWWIRPLMNTSIFLGFVGVPVTFISLLYPIQTIWFVFSMLLFSLSCLILFRREGRLMWLVFAVGLVWTAWLVMLSRLGLSGLQWHTIPFGLLMLIMARAVRRIDPGFTELLAVGMMLYGAAIDVNLRGGVFSLAGLIAALQLIGLFVYGYRAQRPTPLAITLSIGAGGLLWMILKINLWLIPLFAGVLLLAVAVLLEVERARVERWWIDWQRRLGMTSPPKQN